MTKAIIGLGNPGKNYEQTRHNIGFMVVDEVSKRLQIPVSTNKFRALYGEGMFNGERVVLLKPQTYMNLSGESVKALVDWYKLNLEDFIIVYDDLDLPLGQIRLRLKGSAGGHNGVKSLIAHLHTDEIRRIKVGIGRPPAGWAVADYVLSKFTINEMDVLNDTIARAADAALAWLDEPFEKVMNKYNVK